jgi:hypothetical protein
MVKHPSHLPFPGDPSSVPIFRPHLLPVPLLQQLPPLAISPTWSTSPATTILNLSPLCVHSPPIELNEAELRDLLVLRAEEV